MTEPLLRRIEAGEIHRNRRDRVDPETLRLAAAIVEDVRTRGDVAVLEHAVRLGDLKPGDPPVRERRELEAALENLSSSKRELLERTAGRIRDFAGRQRECLVELEVPVPGGSAGHSISPVEHAGCYAPGGRYPLLSSVLMTAVTARVAGVATVWVASPKPAETTLAAAALAGADAVLAVGGAQAVAALAFGMCVAPACDIVVGPGNRWVTAAKQIVAAEVKIDMLAGPSELVVVADTSSDPSTVAADLLAQAEHDPEALSVLIALDESLISAVEKELGAQLENLPTAPVARKALSNGFAVAVQDREEAVRICNLLAPEHLQLMVADTGEYLTELEHYGALFIGSHAAEVLGDCGVGPNHVLPTGGTARFTGGLSVFDFLRIRTWIRSETTPADSMAGDAAALARMEGLEAHARAAARRLMRI